MALVLIYDTKQQKFRAALKNRPRGDFSEQLWGLGGPGGAVVQGSTPLVGVQGVKPPGKKCILEPIF